MDIFTFFAVLILGIILLIIVSIISFVDFLCLLSKIIPLKMPSDFKKHKEFVSSDSYHMHKRKWIKIFAFVSVPYAITYCLISILFDSILIGFYSALVVSIIYLGITSNIEHKQKKALISKTGNTEDIYDFKSR